MAALLKARPSSVREVTRDYRPVAANAKGFKGGLVIILLGGASQGFYQQGAPALGVPVVAVGRFYEDFDNTGGADGALLVQVDFFRERHLFLLVNDTGTPVVAADREAPCYVLDDQTVTGAASQQAAGTVYDVTTEGVWVEVDDAVLSSLADAAGLSNATPQVTTATLGTAGIAATASRGDHVHQVLSIHEIVATITALKAIPVNARADGMIVGVVAGTSGGWEEWRFSAASAAADTSQNLVATPGAGAGRWLRVGGSIALSLAVDHTTADAAVIFTVPAGALFHPREAWWDVTVDWAGGVASAIGIDTSVAGWNTAGDLLGGAAGDLAATLVAASFPRMTGTIGTQFDTRAHGRLIMKAADTIKFNRIVSLYAAGAANVRVLGDLLINPGA